MGRDRAAARPARASWLLVVLAALAVIVHGVADALPGAARQASFAAAASVPPPPGDTSMQAPDAVVVRASALAAVPAPVASGPGALPPAGPLLAPRLVAQPHAGPPAAAPASSAPGAPGSRAPPSPAGT